MRRLSGCWHSAACCTALGSTQRRRAGAAASSGNHGKAAAVSRAAVPARAVHRWCAGGLGPGALPPPAALTPLSPAAAAEERNRRTKQYLKDALGLDAFVRAAAGRPTAELESHQRVTSSNETVVTLDNGSVRPIPSKILLRRVQCEVAGIDWYDLGAHPTCTTREYRDGVASTLSMLGVPDGAVEVALESLLLPQALQVSGNCRVITLRWAVENTDITMDSVQELTNRLTLVLLDATAPSGRCRAFTIHRSYMPIADNIVRQLAMQHRAAPHRSTKAAAAASKDSSSMMFAALVVRECCKTFNVALGRSIVMFDQFEAKLFAPHRQRSTLSRNIYHIKRRASVFSRTLSLTQEALVHTQQMQLFAPDGPAPPPQQPQTPATSGSTPMTTLTPTGTRKAAGTSTSSSSSSSAVPTSPQEVLMQDIFQSITHIRTLADELNENASTVLQLLFQLSSYQLNELMRVLTIFSAFFIPLGFIASFYGMNLASLPFVDDPNGVWYCMTLMVVVACGLATWFRWKRFL